MGFQLFAIRRDSDGLWFSGVRRFGWVSEAHKAKFYHSRHAAGSVDFRAKRTTVVPFTVHQFDESEARDG